MLWRIARLSLWHRRITIGLIVLALTLAFAVLLAVEHIRHEVRDTFTGTVSGVDLIVGARTGSSNLLLYSLFGIGSPTRNMSWDSVETIRQQPAVDWVVPLSMGDSHRGFRVLATSSDFFTHFHYGQKHPLQWQHGQGFATASDVVIGSSVAQQLGYDLGDSLVLAHGQGRTSFSRHTDHPFTITGVLQPTGTPIDQTLLIGLDAMDLIHGGKPGAHPESISALLVGLNSRIQTFTLQRQINEFDDEALLAILPGVELSLLWENLGWIETSLRSIAALVLLSSMLGMITLLLVSIQQRQQELGTLRSLGAGPWFVFALIEIEVLLITASALLLALLTTQLGLLAAGQWLAHITGIQLTLLKIDARLLGWLGLLLLISLLTAVIPAWLASRRSLLQQLHSESH
ncbi:ABC transporter permease [Oceanobacter sp. 5_MG-2023]|uniref:ABC transporter permease n=1 Tax=Oceanobacter sp. 5_MG-2023 TaxID=3062645 RepID=UPI0026E2BE77|nr:ABC transporter permease [Oceanobacter sp. 5_MG-2023]MDO6682465.1 ABC transporter permease [Oceanobacter sp. 5_MG-2023]